MSDLLENIKKESSRIEEDSNNSARSHFNASDQWAKWHQRLGISSSIAVSLGTVAWINQHPFFGGCLCILSVVLTTTLTFLKPSEKAQTHKTAGDQYLILRNRARIFREIEMAGSLKLEQHQKRIIELADQRDQLNQTSPNPLRKNHDLARSDILKD